MMNYYIMVAQPISESLSLNPFLAKDYLNDSNQDPNFIMIFIMLKLATYSHVKLTTN